MAKLKISELTRITTANPTDLLYVVQSNASKSISVNDLLKNFAGLSLSGNVSFGGTPQVINGTGTVDLATPITHIRVGSSLQQVTFPRGANGQIKIFTTTSSQGGTSRLAGNIAGTDLNFSAIGDDAILVYTDGNWHVIGQSEFRSANSYVTSVNGEGPGTVVLTTANISENTNLYFTSDRAYVAAITATTPRLTTANVLELTNLYFSNTRVRQAISITGTGSYDQANGIIDIRGGVSSVNGATGAVVLTTTNIAEGANLYFTNDRAITAVGEPDTIYFGNILPKNTLTYNIGSPTNRWKTGYFAANTLDIGGVLLTTTAGGLNLPVGSTIGGVNPGAIQIKAELANVNLLPASGTVGDGYLIAGNLHVWNSTTWSNLERIQGPIGATGAQGVQGNLGPVGSTGITGAAGTSVTILGSVANVNLLPPTAIDGSGYLIEGNLYVFASNVVTNIGRIQGPQGATGVIGLTGNTGATGVQGATGSIGLTGNVGLTGSTGATGITGNVGATGIQGATGVIGLTGNVGATGVQGATGSIGLTGATGATGSIGSIGLTGNTGSTGVQGATGSIGLTGNVGSTGSTGSTGATGISGLYIVSANVVTSNLIITLNDANVINAGYVLGPTGATGATGVTGNTGSTGATGLQGATGVGSIGATGLRGATGEIGVTGNVGSTGVQGATGLYVVSANVVTSNLIITLNNANVINAGYVLGPTGATGATGNTGSTGVTGTTGATGLTGNVGATGSTGSTGPAGTSVTILGTLPNSTSFPISGNVNGDGYLVTGNLWVYTGNTFTNVGTIQGPQGATGSSGVIGDTGSTGATGLTGNVGATGANSTVQGSTGATGLTGNVGATGFGATGATGLTGSTGLYITSANVNGANLQITLNNSNIIIAGSILGPTGATGLGATGLTGNVGATGATGQAGGFSTGSNGQVNSLGVGTTASGTAGEIRATNNITAYYSDDRLKTKLGPITNALDKIKQLSGFYYQANEIAQALGYEVKQEVGVSAQEVQKVQPEVVAPAPIDEKYLTVRYERLIPLIIEAIKELDEKVNELKDK